MRSLLFVPGDSERKQAKALASGADALILDLEDSVAAAAKADARSRTRDFIAGAREAAAPLLYVRVNDLGTGMTGDDLAGVMAARPDGIMLPKCHGPDDVMALGAMLRVAEAENGIPDGQTAIIPIVTETARAVLLAAGFIRPLPRLAGLTWGAEDLSASIGARAAREDNGDYTDLFRLARSLTLLAASACETDAVDTVFPNFRDADGFARDCRTAQRDGFTAKMAIHPDQVPVINAAFTPTDEAKAQAARVVEAFAEAGDPGVVAIDGRMYDRPHLRLAQRLLARAERVR